MELVLDPVCVSLELPADAASVGSCLSLELPADAASAGSYLFIS